MGQHLRPPSVATLLDMLGGEIKSDEIKFSGPAIATDSALRLALDRDSVRTVDRDGRLHVAIANISKACVNPYKGSEIPDWENLGLDPNKIYMLLRDPEELRKAAPSFNGIQIMRKHIPVSADDTQQWDVVGATGTSCEFNDTYLTNGLSVWVRDAIDDIESEAKKELSSGYHYRADMTAGNFNGTAYDGVMRDIVGNHVALVKDGRAGPDVVVGDSGEEIKMSNRELAKHIAAVAARTVSVAALHTYLKPRLAMDAKIPANFTAAVFDGIKGKDFGDKKQIKVIADRVRVAAKHVIAKDTSLDDVEKVLGMLSKHEVDGGGEESVSKAEHNAMEAAAAGNSELDIPKKVDEEFSDKDKKAVFDEEGFRKFLGGKGIGEDDINTAMGMIPKPNALDEFPPKDDDEKKKAEDEFPPKDDDDDDAKKKKKKAEEEAKAKDAVMKDMVSKPAMDAALKANSTATEKRVRAQMREIADAERAVAPYVGELTMGFDSAADVYRHALGILGVEGAKDLHESSLKTILGYQTKLGAKAVERSTSLGMDSAEIKGFNERFPGAAAIQSV